MNFQLFGKVLLVNSDWKSVNDIKSKYRVTDVSHLYAELCIYTSSYIINISLCESGSLLNFSHQVTVKDNNRNAFITVAWAQAGTLCVTSACLVVLGKDTYSSVTSKLLILESEAFKWTAFI